MHPAGLCLRKFRNEFTGRFRSINVRCRSQCDQSSHRAASGLPAQAFKAWSCFLLNMHRFAGVDRAELTISSNVSVRLKAARLLWARPTTWRPKLFCEAATAPPPTGGPLEYCCKACGLHVSTGWNCFMLRPVTDAQVRASVQRDPVRQGEPKSHYGFDCRNYQRPLLPFPSFCIGHRSHQASSHARSSGTPGLPSTSP